MSPDLNPDGAELIISCEHAGNKVPAGYQHLFNGQKELLESHRGYDIGALILARQLSRSLRIPLFYSRYTRLLVELNRSLHHPRLFSAITSGLPQAAQAHILKKYYTPYRRRILQAVDHAVAQGKKVIHFSIHTFTPVLNGIKRNAELGVLYDPRRKMEKAVSTRLIDVLRANDFPTLTIRRNYPYKGTADGLTSHLRKQFDDPHYAGLEIEVNQILFFQDLRTWRDIGNHIASAISQTAGVSS